MGYQLRMFYLTAIKPFIDPFIDLWNHTLLKIFFGILWTTSWIASQAQLVEELPTALAQLLTLPPKLWMGLNLLILADFLSGTARAVFSENHYFRWRRWTRTAYKFCAYNGACLMTTIIVNMWPEQWALLVVVQYVVYAVLAGQEFFSGLRNMNLLSLIDAIWGVLKTGKVNIGDIMDRWQKKTKTEDDETEGRFTEMEKYCDKKDPKKPAPGNG